MIDEQLEEQASLYALGVIEPEEKASFEEKLARDEELQRLVRDLTAAAASLAHSAPRRVPPPHLEEQILRQIRSEKITALPARRVAWVPWAIAAALALSTALLFFSREKITRELTELKTQRQQALTEIMELAKRESEARTQVAALSAQKQRLADDVARLEARDSLSQMQIATLTSKLEAAPRAAAFVIWDAKNQRGVLTAVDVPPNAADHDYQLWVVDPKYQIPVDAGVFTVDKNGVAKVPFKPKQQISSADAFAITLERKGGVNKAEGPMVLVGK